MTQSRSNLRHSLKTLSNSNVGTHISIKSFPSRSDEISDKFSIALSITPVSFADIRVDDCRFNPMTSLHNFLFFAARAMLARINPNPIMTIRLK